MKSSFGMDESGRGYDDVAIGDTFGGGVVVLAGVCRNQEGTVVADADGRILVAA